MANKVPFVTRQSPQVVKQKLQQILVEIDDTFWDGGIIGMTGYVMLGSENNYGFRHVEDDVYEFWSRRELPENFGAALEFLL